MGKAGNVGFQKIVRLISEPHDSITNPVTRQVCRFTAVANLIGLPLPLLLYVLRVEMHVAESNYSPGINIVATVFIFLSYLVVRTKYFRLSLFFQVFAAATLPLVLAFVSPASFNVGLGVILAVILSAIFFGQREIVSVTLICNVGLIILLSVSAGDKLFIIAKTTVTLNVAAMLIFFLRGHQSWLTEYRKTKLSDQVQRYRRLASSSFDGIATLQNGRLIEVSEGFADIFGLSVRQCIGKKLTDLLPQFHDSHSQLETYAIGNNYNKTVTRQVLLAVNRVDKERSLLAVRDTTNQQREQMMQLQMDRMTATGTLASGIAHELNTPLMVAMNQTRIAMSELAEHQHDDLAKRLSAVDEVLAQIVTIVSDLKWYVQSASEDEQTPSSTLIEKAVHLARHRIRQHCQISLELNSIGVSALPDHAMIQLITNLLFNAVDARRIEQDHASIRIRNRDDGAHLYVEVSDDGIGISDSVKERIFEPFYTYGKKAGSGLGLSICASLLSRVDGKIEVESEPGNGCTFRMTIPLANAHAASQPTQMHPRIDKILVIDDDPVLPELIAEILLDFRCLFADNVEDACQILETEQVDAILCDVNMPCGGASTLYRYLRTHQHLLADRMVMITGGAVTVEMQSFIETTAQPVIYKPFRAQQITEALASLS